MNESLEIERYIKAINISQLQYDLNIFPAGHNLEIGERG